MSFDLFSFDFMPKDRLIGMWVIGLKNYEGFNRHFFCIYWNDGELMVELFWCRVLSWFPTI